MVEEAHIVINILRRCGGWPFTEELNQKISLSGRKEGPGVGRAEQGVKDAPSSDNQPIPDGGPNWAFPQY